MLLKGITLQMRDGGLQPPKAGRERPDSKCRGVLSAACSSEYMLQEKSMHLFQHSSEFGMCWIARTRLDDVQGWSHPKESRSFNPKTPFSSHSHLACGRRC